MGNSCRIVAPDAEIAAAGEAMVHDLDERWSRFRATSEVSVMNRAAGCLTIVSAETFRLVELAEHARLVTDGWFHPLLLTRLEELGYDATWTAIPADAHLPVPEARLPAVLEPIELVATLSAVRLPDATRFDPGGIGKGLAADLVAERLVDAGATSVQVELGGDVRVSGEPWVGHEWSVTVEHVDGGRACAQLSLPGGGVATSGTHRRAWRRDGRRLHHLIDPHTMWPASTDLTAVTVAASSSWFAEVTAKAVLMMGADAGRRHLRRHGLAGVLHHRAGATAAVEVVHNMEAVA